jgi:hypothetical protein
MARVCLVGDPDVNLRYELLSRETARDALATYDLHEPFANTVAIETVSLGSAVALLNDLNWYLVRFVDDVFVLEPSVSEREWLSRDLAAAVRDDELAPEETDRFLKIYGIVDHDAESEAGPPGDGDAEPDAGGTDGVSEGADDGAAGPTTERPPELVEPMYVTRTGRDLPSYDLREVDDTLVVRVREGEFGGERQR